MSKARLIFHVPESEYDQAEFSRRHSVDISGDLVIVEEVGDIKGDTYDDGFGNQYDLGGLVESTHFHSLEILEHDHWEPR